jgi:hypothetical protein
MVVAGFTPLVEEIVFRGAFYLPLRRALGIAPAMLIVSSVFAVTHAHVWSMPQLLLLSCILVVLLEYSRSLWPAIIVHGLNNALSLILLWSLPVDGGGIA